MSADVSQLLDMIVAETQRRGHELSITETIDVMKKWKLVSGQEWTAFDHQMEKWFLEALGLEQETFDN